MDFTSCVWPGDANSDLIANNVDLLAIGLVYSSNGDPRTNASLNWTAQPVRDWDDTLPSGVNAKHADCDGNGVVNDDDTLGITVNYGLTHNKIEEREWNRPVQRTEIATGHLAAGVYLLELRVGSEQVRRKLVVTR